MASEAVGGRRSGWDAQHPGIVAIGERVCLLLVAPLLIAYRLRMISFESVGQILSLQPGAVGLLARRAWYRATLDQCGDRLRVSFGTVIRRADCRIADDCHLGEYNRVGTAHIGAQFMSADHVSVVGGPSAHGFERRDIPMREQVGTLSPVVIGEDVWVGSHATIVADVAAHSVVGAGAVVTRTFAEWSILAGVPARVLRTRP